MKVSPSKSRSVFSHQRNQWFFINDEPIATVSEKPVQRLGRWYDKSQGPWTGPGIEAGHQQRPWEHQLVNVPWQAEALVPCLMWPLTIYDIPLTRVRWIKKMINSSVRKWLGVPRCLCNIGWYDQGGFELPLLSLAEEIKCPKARREMTLSVSGHSCKRCSTIFDNRMENGRCKWTKACSPPGKASLPERWHCGPCSTGKRRLWSLSGQTLLKNGNLAEFGRKRQQNELRLSHKLRWDSGWDGSILRKASSLEGLVGDEDKQNQLPASKNLWCPSFAKESQPVTDWRSVLLPVFNTSYPQTNPHWVESESLPR